MNPPCPDEDCINNSTIVTALSRANTPDSLEIAATSAARLANELQKSESLSRRISRCFGTFSAANKITNTNRAHYTIFSVAGGNMTTGVGEAVATQGEKAKLVKGYRVSLLDWGRGRDKKKGSKGQSSANGKGLVEEDGGNGSGAGIGTTDLSPKSTTTAASNSITTKPNTNFSPPEANNTPKGSSHSMPRNPKGKSPLPRSLRRRRSSSSGSDSDVTSISSGSSSSSFGYGPPEFQDAKSKEEEPIIPDPGVFRSTRLAQIPLTEHNPKERGDMAAAYIPTVAQCAAHLELLGCFSKLRAKVEGSEEIGRWLFGKGHDAKGTSGAGDIKWRAFVGKAVERFHMWWMNFPEVVKKLSEPEDRGKSRPVSFTDKPKSTLVKNQARPKPLEEKNLFLRHWKRKPAKPGVTGTLAEIQKSDFAGGISFTNMAAEVLPPLDVLLVWHAYTLNPHAFYEDCIRLNRLELWGMPLPWDLIHDAIDNYDFAFTLQSTAASFFTKLTGQPADLYQSLVGAGEESVGGNSTDGPRELPQVELHCPWCERPSNVPLAEWHEAGDVGDYGGACGNCGKAYEKEAVSVSMFLKDVHRFFLTEKEREREEGTSDESARCAISKTPGFMFRGGVLHPPTGHYIPPGHPSTLDRTFPSPTLLSGVLLSAFPQLHPTTNNHPPPDIPSLLINFPNTSTLLSHLSNHTQLANNPDDTISPIPVLKRLLTNIVTTYKHLPPPTPSTPVATSTDLGAAVLRQGVFIKRIHDSARHIRSPALVGTVQRARERYDKFFRLIGKYRGQIFVPTNEIDLVWHTQQCFPALYYLYSNLVTANAGVGGGGKYIDHNDRLAEGVLSNGFEETKRIWRVEYHCVRRNSGEGGIPLGWGGWWSVLTGWKLGGRKEKSNHTAVTSAVRGESAVEDDEESSTEGEEENVENSSSAAVTSVTPRTGNDAQKDLGEVEGPSSSPAEDWDEEGGYAIFCCWNCEMKRDIQEEIGRGSYRKWGTGTRKGKVGFTRKEEWKLRATVYYYRSVEAARNEGKRLPVWKIREPWVGSR